ncbi:unnamed protein product [Ilex paraguariensis]|uniref:Beta-carotene isomerase D27-like C-terminal domain-containing protein n=1 Tax=Ilex paraguariensis TaxID=185542 RepID=A0ABC8UBX7_9AQUA
MEANHLLRPQSPFPATGARRKHMHKPKVSHHHVLAVLTRPTKNVEGLTSSKTVYNDNWFDRLAINHLSHNVQAASGLRNNKGGYDGLVEAAKVASRNFNPTQQQKIIIEALDKAFPKPILYLANEFCKVIISSDKAVLFVINIHKMWHRLSVHIAIYVLRDIRMILPESKLAREYFAAFTTVFFSWLVGPCEVRESEFNGGREKNVVHIKKCRFLEETNCVGLCANLCKMPSQVFIKDSLGIPVNMVPSKYPVIASVSL